MHVINTLAPVFLLIALGAYLKRSKFFSDSFIDGINKLTYWIGLPTLLFYKIANATYGYDIAAKTYAVLAGGMIGCIIAAYILCLILKVPSKASGAFVQGSFRGNLMYIGLPIVIYSFQGQSAELIAKAEQTTILTLSMIVPTYNVVSVIALLAGQHKLDRYVPIKIAKELIRNPLIIACIAGVLYSAIFHQLPTSLTRTCEAIGRMALPLALFSIGATLISSKDLSHLKQSSFASCIKVFLAPIIGYPIAHYMGLTASEIQVALILLACPTAISSFVLAEQLGSDKMLSASIVILTSILSIVSLSVIIAKFSI